VRASRAIGRNEPCPCGSGRKFKRCCGGVQDHTAWAASSAARQSGQADVSLAQQPLRPEEAISNLRAALLLEPRNVPALVELGNRLHDSGRHGEALTALQQALAIAPDLVGLKLNIALALQASDRLDEAIDHCRQVAASARDSAAARCTLATLLRLAGDLEEAEIALRAAVSIEPLNAVAHFERGNVLSSLGRSTDAVQAYERAITLAPANPAYRSALILSLLYLSDGGDPRLQQQMRQFDAIISAPHVRVPIQRPALRFGRNSRLRLGYVSADLREHSVAYFLEPVLEAHDRDRVEVFCYSCSDAKDSVTLRLKSLSEHWQQAGSLNDAALAQQIRDDRIDVLIDLSGHTAGNRLGVFAQRPAPLQITWLGYPGDTGLRAIDGFIGDGVVDAKSPALIRLPQVFSCFRPFEGAPPVVPTPAVDEQCITLGSFNNLAKVSDTTVALWARVLNEIPGCRLLLKHRSFQGEGMRGWVRRRFAVHGVDAQRLELVPREADAASHLAQYGRVDISLDPFPYCGVTTTCESLWMGVPVVSLAGAHFSSRTGLSLLRAVGREEWVAHDEDGYVERIRALSADPERLSAIRVKLRNAVASSALVDARTLTRALEEALVALVR